MKKKRIGIFAVISIVLFISIISLSGKQGLISLYKNHNEYRKQSLKLVQSHKIIDSLKTDISRLRNDTDYIEKIAREKLGMAKKNEKVYKFIEE